MKGPHVTIAPSFDGETFEQMKGWETVTSASVLYSWRCTSERTELSPLIRPMR